MIEKGIHYSKEYCNFFSFLKIFIVYQFGRLHREDCDKYSRNRYDLEMIVEEYTYTNTY